MPINFEDLKVISVITRLFHPQNGFKALYLNYFSRK